MEKIKLYFIIIKMTYKYEKAMYNFKTIILEKFFTPFCFLLFYCLFITNFSQDNFYYTILGVIIWQSAITALSGSALEVVRERGLGTLRYVSASATNFFEYFICKCVIHIIDGMIRFNVLFILIILFINEGNVTINEICVLNCINLLATISACAFGLILGSIGLIIRNINLIINFAQSALLLICGVNYNVEVLPSLLRAFSRVLPITNAIESVRLYSICNYKLALHYFNIEVVVLLFYFCLFIFISKKAKEIAIKFNKIDMF